MSKKEYDLLMLGPATRDENVDYTGALDRIRLIRAYGVALTVPGNSRKDHRFYPKVLLFCSEIYYSSKRQ